MKIYIMRHGQAGMHAKTDSKRPLTELGMTESIKMARWLAPQLEGSIDWVLHSNYLRAQQTWQAISLELPITTAIVEENSDITPDGDPSLVADYLIAMATEHNYKQILMVSHLPLVGFLIQALCATPSAPIFSTSGIACIEWHHEKGEFLWLEGPHTLD